MLASSDYTSDYIRGLRLPAILGVCDSVIRAVSRLGRVCGFNEVFLLWSICAGRIPATSCR